MMRIRFHVGVLRMPLVSVVIPAYNGVSRFLEEAIRSVLAQTHPEREVIVVDDASTDDTAGLVSRFPGVRYIRREANGGQARARNHGASLASGTYLAFLDQDDLWEPTFLAELVGVLEAHPEAAAVHADGYQVSERNAVLEYDAAMKDMTSITQLLRGGHDVATSGSVFRKSCFDSVGGYDDALAVWEDIDLAIRLYQRYPILHHPKPLYRHRLYRWNASRGIPSQRSLDGRRWFLEKHGPSCRPGTREARALRHDWSRYYGDLGKHYLGHGQPGRARRAFWRSIRHNPCDLKPFLRFLRSLVTLKARGAESGDAAVS